MSMLRKIDASVLIAPTRRRRGSLLHPALGFALVGLLLGQGALMAQAGETIRVTLDQAKLLKLPGGTETLVVGNPGIADLSLQKNGIVVLTGRTPGQTNLIAIDENGTIISETMIQVSSNFDGKLLVQRGMEQSSYDCSQKCLPTVMLGDSEKFLAGTIDQTLKRDGLASNQQGPAEKKKN